MTNINEATAIPDISWGEIIESKLPQYFFGISTEVPNYETLGLDNLRNLLNIYYDKGYRVEEQRAYILRGYEPLFQHPISMQPKEVEVNFNTLVNDIKYVVFRMLNSSSPNYNHIYTLLKLRQCLDTGHILYEDKQKLSLYIVDNDKLFYDTTSIKLAKNHYNHNQKVGSTLLSVLSHDCPIKLVNGKDTLDIFAKYRLKLLSLNLQTYRAVHELKVGMMFDGASELEALKIMGFKQHTIVYCEITKQLIPLKFAKKLLSGGYILNKMRDYYPFIFMDTVDGVEHVKSIMIDSSSFYNSETNSGLGYLTPKVHELENPKNIPYMGIELEVERADPTCAHAMQSVLETLGWDYIVLQPDGSLRGTFAFEIITAPASLKFHQEKWDKFLSKQPASKFGLKSWESGRCGMHVHISRKAFTGLHLAKFLYFINSDVNRLFISKLAGRGSVRYALRTRGSLRDNLYRVGNIHKYSFVNTSKKDTVELRIFRGNLSKLGFMKNLEFAHAAYKYTQYAPMNELDYKAFLRWVFDPTNDTGEYTHLRKWLIQAGLNVSNIVIKKDVSAARRLQLLETRKKVKKIQKVINFRYKKTTSEQLVA
jgi:hypothetical protein